MDGLVLEVAGRKDIHLGPNTLVVALDETGHEDFADPQYPVFGIGGCAVLVSDYERLSSNPWNYMCETFFPEYGRPMHAADLRNPSQAQLNAFRHFFEEFQFFRIAVTITKEATSPGDVDFIELVGKCTLQRIADIAKWIQFDRIVILVEQSQRIGVKIMQAMSGRHLVHNDAQINIELGLIPKSAQSEAIEVADFVIHTAGTQTRDREAGKPIRKDFEIVFRNVDEHLTSFMEITSVEER